MGNRFARGKSPIITHIPSKDRWKELIEASKESLNLMVVNFASTRCKRCWEIEPITIDLAMEFCDVRFVKIDADDLQDVFAEYAVSYTPTFLFFKKGKEVDRVDGVDMKKLREMIIKHRV